MTRFQMKRSILVVATIVLSVVCGTVRAGSLENLERERAAMIETILDGGIRNSDRQKKIEISRNQLIDLERMVLRDQSLKGKNTRAVQMALKNYDLTFLVHDSKEKRMSVSDHWLGEVGLTTASLMNARMGRR